MQKAWIDFQTEFTGTVVITVILKYAKNVLQCFDAVSLVIWPVKIVPKMTYYVLRGTLSLYTTTTNTQQEALLLHQHPFRDVERNLWRACFQFPSLPFPSLPSTSLSAALLLSFASPLPYK